MQIYFYANEARQLKCFSKKKKPLTSVEIHKKKISVRNTNHDTRSMNELKLIELNFFFLFKLYNTEIVCCDRS